MLKWWKSELRILGRKSERAYLRFFPNPGFMFTIGGTRVKWSRFYGWRKERINATVR